MTETDNIPEKVRAAIRKYQFERLPIEGTFYKSTYRSKEDMLSGEPVGTAMIGMYCFHPKSESAFHRLTHDEVWHVYEGDPFELILLYPDGTGRHVCMGGAHGEIQYVVPAGVYQAGRLLPEGTYAIYGTTMAPGFTGACFEAGCREELLKQYPSFAKEILALTDEHTQKTMPEGFSR